MSWYKGEYIYLFISMKHHKMYVMDMYKGHSCIYKMWTCLTTLTDNIWIQFEHEKKNYTDENFITHVHCCCTQKLCNKSGQEIK